VIIQVIQSLTEAPFLLKMFYFNELLGFWHFTSTLLKLIYLLSQLIEFLKINTSKLGKKINLTKNYWINMLFI